MTADASQPARRVVDTRHPQDTTAILAHAADQAQHRNLVDYLIVDADCHHYENDSIEEIIALIDDPIVKRMAEHRRGSLIGISIADQDLSGRILSGTAARRGEAGESGKPRDVVLARRAMAAMGIDYSILFPSPMLVLGIHPQVDVEVAIARAYARWMTEKILPADSSIKSLLYLPFNRPDACLRMVEEFGDRPGVIGFLMTSVRYRAIHDDAYLPLYAELERRELPLGIHGSHNWNDRAFELLNRFISVHALAFPFYSMIHMTNWVINGMPERFPGLKLVWIEGGLAYVPYLMQRLDHEFMMRSSEAPLLKRLPSDYMRDFYYTSQPLEVGVHDLTPLKTTFEMINAESQLLFASDYPHWDFDLPSRIFDLPFLTDHARRRILGQNAHDLFKLDRR